MWPALIFTYSTGMVVTAVRVFTNRIFNREYLLNFIAILAWPLYWSLFLISLYNNRAKSG